MICYNRALKTEGLHPPKLMLVHRLADRARKFLPESLLTPLKRLATAVLTPLEWSYHTGHFRSALAGVAVDKRGDPLAWYTYPAVEFLSHHDFRGKRVLELGAGQSTLWWANRASLVVALEDDPRWIEKISRRLPNNVSLHLASTWEPDNSLLLSHAPYDIIVIDGLDRLGYARACASLLAPQGAIVFDNSEGTWGGDADGTYPIIDLFREAGFSKLDFYGWSPVGIAPHCTSILFKAKCFLLACTNPPAKTVN